MCKRLCLSTLLVMLAAVSACQKTQQETLLPQVVLTVHPQQAALEKTLHLIGTVVSPEQAALGFQVAGRIQVRQVEVGDHVRAGQVLMALDDRDYRLRLESLEAQRRATASDLETAQRDLARLEDLRSRKLVSQQQVDNARNLVTKLKSQLAALAPQIEQARNQLAYTRLKAPFDGVVTARKADVGQVAGIGVPVLTLAADARAAVFDWPEQGSEPPENASITVDGKQISARLDYVAPQADPLSRTIPVRYRIDVPVALGRSATLDVAQKGETLWRIPSTAVRMEKGRAVVFAVVEDRLRPVAVELVRLDHDSAWVRGALNGDMTLVRMGVHVLKSDQQVRVKQDG